MLLVDQLMLDSMLYLYIFSCRASRPLSPLPQFSESQNQASSEDQEQDELTYNMEETNNVNGNSQDFTSEMVTKNLMDPNEMNGNLEDPGKIYNGSTLSRDTSSVDLASELSVQNTLAAIAQIDAQHCGLPLPLFSNVSIFFCHRSK